MADSSKHKSKIPAIFLLLLLCIAIIGASTWIALKKGITLKRLTISSVEIEQLALRLDDRFIISIDRLNILEGKTEATPMQHGVLITRFNEWAHLLQEIRINRVAYGNNTYTVRFKDNIFSVTGNDFHLISTLAYEEDEVLMEIADLAINPYQIKLTGKTSFHSKTKQFNFTGLFTAEDISGQVELSYHRGKVNAELQTDRFTDLRSLLTQLSVDEEAVTWVDENIRAKDYIINQLHLDFLMVNGKPDIQPSSITGSGLASDASIQFDPSLPPVLCKNIHVSYKNDQLTFGLGEPLYKEKRLTGSTVLITNLLIGDSHLIINIQTETQLDDEIHEILQAYDIDLPFTQYSGATKADLYLDFDLPDFTLNTRGNFTTEKGEWTWGNVAYRTDGAHVKLKDDLVSIEKAEILYQDILEASVNGIVNTSKNQAELSADIQQFDFRDRDNEIVRIKELTTPVNIQYNQQEVSINLLHLKTEISLSPSGNILKLNDLNSVKQYIPFLVNFPLDEGNIHIDFTKPDMLKFTGFIETSAIPLRSEDESITHFTLKGTNTADELKATLNDEKISLTLSDKLIIHLHDYQVIIDLDQIAELEGTVTPLPVFITGPAILIQSEGFSVPAKNFLADLSGQHINFSAHFDQGSVLFKSDGEEMSLTASEINAMIAQNFFPSTDLEGGKFNLSLTGKNSKNFVGVVEFSNVLIERGVILNNVLSFINAIPALATLSAPGFDSDGYQVNEGIAYFAINNDLLTIHQFRSDGETINCAAEGWIDLENKTLEIKLEMISLKDYSKIIDKIPWFGYVFLGEDGSISTSLDIRGSLEQPEISTNLTKEIVMTPVNVVERTVKWPFRVFDRMKELKSQQPEQPEDEYIYKKETQ